jgi:hypothetical protein
MMQRVNTSDALYTAVIHAVDGVWFTAAAPNAWSLASQVVEYIEGRCDDTLWPAMAAEVRGLIAARRPYAAIAAYFLHVGARWDEEFLELGGPAVDSPSFPRSVPRRRALSPAT